MDEIYFKFPKAKKPSYLITADFFTGLEKKGFSWLRHRDDLGNYWYTGFSNLSPGVAEFFLRSPKELPYQEQLLTLMDYFQSVGFSQVPKTKMGLVMQLESGHSPNGLTTRRNFHFYDMEQLENLVAQGLIPNAQKHSFENYLDFLMDGYGRRMRIPEDKKKELKDISVQLKKRSHLLFLSQQGMIDMRDEFNIAHVRYDAATYNKYGKNPDLYPTRVLPEKFDFVGGAIVVTSKSAQELLPLEVFTGFKVPRKSGVTAEIGRFYVDRLHRDPNTSYALIGLIGSLLSTAKDQRLGRVDQIVLEADEARAHVFAEYGCVPVHERTNFQGKKEFIMVADPAVVTERARAKLLKELNAEKTYTATVLYRPKEINLTVAREFAWDRQNYRGPYHSFGDSNFGFLASEMYDLNKSPLDMSAKVAATKKAIELSHTNLESIFAKNPETVTTTLLTAINEGTKVFFNAIKNLRRPYMTESDYQNAYRLETIYGHFEKLDKSMPPYWSKFERLNAIFDLMETHQDFWIGLNGDHGKTYMLLDYYLNGGIFHTSLDSFKLALNRNSGSDLNIFDVAIPEANKEFSKLIFNSYHTPKMYRHLPTIKTRAYQIFKADPKFAETDFEIVWKEMKKVIESKDENKDADEIKWQIKYLFWHKVVYISKYIEDIRFVERKPSDD